MSESASDVQATSEQRMTQRDLATTPRPLGKQPSHRLRIPPRVQVACKAIVHEGLELDEAAKAAGLTTRALRLALERKHVIEHLKAEREVFRSYVRAQNIHRAKQLRDSAGNAMAQLGAMKFIEGIDGEDPAVAARRQSPGVVIVVTSGAADMAHMREIEAKPLIDNADVPHDE